MNIRCEHCGSKNVQVTVQQNNSYSVKKGFWGTLLFGNSGAVMGVNGKKSSSTLYICQACGHTSKYPMDEYNTRSIENALRNNWESDLERWKEKYPNFEWEAPKKALDVTDSEEIEKAIFDVLKNPKKYDAYSFENKGIRAPEILTALRRRYDADIGISILVHTLTQMLNSPDYPITKTVEQRIAYFRYEPTKKHAPHKSSNDKKQSLDITNVKEVKEAILSILKNSQACNHSNNKDAMGKVGISQELKQLYSSTYFGTETIRMIWDLVDEMANSPDCPVTEIAGKPNRYKYDPPKISKE